MIDASTCVVQTVTDADTVRAICDGVPQRIRLAGISALEKNGSCNSRPYCPTMRHAQAKPIVERLTIGRTFRFTWYGRSGKRLIGDNPWLRCQIVSTRAAVEWPRYMREYRLRGCR